MERAYCQAKSDQFALPAAGSSAPPLPPDGTVEGPRLKTPVSVIIPVHNGAGFLRTALGALAREQATERLHEIIVVDDGSTDESANVGREFGFRVVQNDVRGGPASARNLGVRHATGAWLWFLDADVEITPGSIDVVEAFVNTPSGENAAIGSYDTNPSAPGLCSQFKNLFHHFVHQQAGHRVSSFWAGCGIVRKSAFEEAGGFDAIAWPEPSIEDIELGYRLGARGVVIRVLPELQVTHHKAWTLGSLVLTDTFRRAVPWTVLLLSRRHEGNTELNLGWSYRLGVIVSWLGAACFLAVPFSPAFLVGGLAALVTIALLNLRLLRFFASIRGPFFALRTVPLLWLYGLYSGVGAGLGILEYLRKRVLPGPSAARTLDAGDRGGKP